jgi:hypothetical protein
MGMNPDTNKFEILTKPGEISEIEKAVAKFSGKMCDYRVDLLRPDGSPVPKHWSVFKIGELVTIKDYTFRVAYVGESNILFEPVKPDEPIIV